MSEENIFLLDEFGNPTGKPLKKMKYFYEWGGSANCIIDGKVKNMAEHLNEIERNKHE